MPTRDYDEFEKQFYEVTNRVHDLLETREVHKDLKLYMHTTQMTLITFGCRGLNSRHLTTHLRNGCLSIITFSMVHENSGLNEFQKLYYLKNCLEEEAEEIIS